VKVSELDATGHDTFYELEDADAGDMKHVSLDVRKGEALGLCGLLGSGRTETVRMMFGIDAMRAKNVTIGGKKLKLKTPLAAIRSNVAFCPEDRKTEGIVGDLTVRENIVMALQSKRGVFKKIPGAEAAKIADEYIEKLAIKVSGPDQLIKNLSGGNQQKVILARWLATHPELLMLDEPTRGIDIGTKAEIQKIVIQLAKDGLALVFISSEIDEMLRCCSRMLILRDKKIIGELSGEDISEKAVMNRIAKGEG
jgi:simple sugar transport system ATP-binding protein